jgi:hypothetical protein
MNTTVQRKPSDESAPAEPESRHYCRFCETPLQNIFIDLGMSPLCESYRSSRQLSEMERFYPLCVYVCSGCYLVQLPGHVSPDSIFSEYAYFSSYSDSWLAHAKRYVGMVVERFALSSRSFVVEIASNDGYLLQYFVERGIPVMGIEPAANIAAVAVSKGIPTDVRFFGRETAGEMAAKGLRPDLLLGNNVLAHVPDINDFVGGLKILLADNGLITMEFPHLMQLMEYNQFDTIYHEHFSYLSLASVERIFGAHGLKLFDVEELPTHGGSLRIYGCHSSCKRYPVSPRVQALREKEAMAGLERMENYAAFSGRVKNIKWELLSFLIDTKRKGKSVAGYGAPGKGNTLLNYCGIRTDFLDYTVDRNPYKHGKFLPGTGIPIYPVSRIEETRPDYVLVLPWNLKDEIIRQMKHIRDWGGKFIVPIPELTVIP